MKKQVIIALALCLSMVSFAQKKELKAAEKALKNNNFSEAKTVLEKVGTLLYGASDETKAKYYFLKGRMLYANGTGNEADFDEALVNLNKSQSDYGSEVAEIKKNMENSLLTEANELYTANSFTEASNNFEKLYKVVPTDTTYLYYAAVSAVTGKDNEKALSHYLALKDLGYTGVEKQYFAINKETGAEEIFDKNTRDLYVKSGDYIKPGERTTESKQGEITKNIAFIYVSQGKTEEALAAVKEVRAMNPKDVNLILTEANLYHEKGDLDSYKKLIEEAITLDPNNVDLFFNLGVISAEAGDVAKAQEYYGKAIEMDPTSINAQTNMAALILGKEEALIEEMNGLGTSSADNKRYDELKAERMALYNEAIPYLESVMTIDAANIDVARTLMNIYSAIDNTAKFDEMKALVNKLEGGN